MYVRPSQWTGIDPRKQEHARYWRDAFRRAEILNEALDDFEYVEPVSIRTIQRLAGMDGGEWKYVSREYADVMDYFAVDGAGYRRKLGLILRDLKPELLKDFKTPQQLKAEKAARQTAYMRSRRKPPKAKPESKMSAQGRENIRQGAIRRWKELKAKENK